MSTQKIIEAYQRQEIADRKTIKHLESVIEGLAALAQERMEIDKCDSCGYYERSKNIEICEHCEQSTCKDCLGDEACCPSSDEEDGESDPSSS